MRGIITMKRGYKDTINTEFPALIYTHSTERINTTRSFPVMNYDLVLNNPNIIEYVRGLKWDIDIIRYKDGFLMNDMIRWNQPITLSRIEIMEKVHLGETDCTFNERYQFIKGSFDLHYLTQVLFPGTKYLMFQCTCYKFYTNQYCYHSLINQHMNSLRNHCDKIPTKKTSSKHLTERQKEKNIMDVAKKMRNDYNKQTKVNVENTVDDNDDIINYDHDDDDDDDNSSDQQLAGENSQTVCVTQETFLSQSSIGNQTDDMGDTNQTDERFEDSLLVLPVEEKKW